MNTTLWLRVSTGSRGHRVRPLVRCAGLALLIAFLTVPPAFAAVPSVTAHAARQPDNPAPYGCQAPHLDGLTYAKPGQPLKVTGSDLGVWGQIFFGDLLIDPDTWTDTAFTFTVPDDAVGQYAIKINCLNESNVVTVDVPDNQFAFVSEKAKRGKAVGTLNLSLPGPGDVDVTGKYTKAVHKTFQKGGTVTVSVRLNKTGVRKLKHAKGAGWFEPDFKVSFTPTGGSTFSQSDFISFRKRK